MRKNLYFACTCLICFFLIAPVLYYSAAQLYVWHRSNTSLMERFYSLDNTFFKNLVFIRTLPPNKHILTFDQTLLYEYTKAQFIPYLDSRLLPIYEAKTKAQVYQLLKEMKIDYVDTFYIEPVLINSKLIDMLNDPSYAHLVFQSYKKIYQLNNEIKKITYYPIKNTTFYDAKIDNLKQYFFKEKITQISLFFRKTKNIVAAFIWLLPTDFDNINKIFQINYNLSGFGYYKLICKELGQSGLLINSSVIFEDVLNNQSRQRKVQFFLKPATKNFELVFELQRVGEIKINELNLRYFFKEQMVKNWFLMEPHLMNDLQLRLNISPDLFFLHETSNGFKVNKNDVQIPLIVYQKSMHDIHQIDFVAKGHGKINLYYIYNGTIIGKINEDVIHLQKNYQHYHFETLTKKHDYQIGFQLINQKKPDNFALKDFKYE